MILKILSFDWALWFFWIMATTIGWFLGEAIFPSLAFITSGFMIGIFQWLVLQGRLTHPLRWIAATAIGWSVGYFLIIFTSLREIDSLTGVLAGLSIGIAQWPILRRELTWAGWWIVFSVIGWVTGLTLLPGIFLTGTIAGAITGFVLCILLQYPKPKPNQSLDRT